MAQLEPLKVDIESMGTQLAFIAAEKQSGIHKPAKFLASHPVSFPFLLDEDRKVTKEYGLYHRVGLDAFNIAHPATLVIDRDGVVRYVYRGNNQSERAPTGQVLEAIAKLRD
jgi:peroxiredoxin